MVNVHGWTLQPDEAMTQRMCTETNDGQMKPTKRGRGGKRSDNVPASSNPDSSKCKSKGKKRKSDGARPKNEPKRAHKRGRKNTQATYIADRECPVKSKLTMITINVNGKKVPGKSLIMGHFLHQENIDICVAVETQSRKI